MLLEALLVPESNTSSTKLQRQNTNARISKIVILIIASHCGRGCSHHIQRIILAQVPSLYPTALLRYGEKARVKLIESCTIFTTEILAEYFALPRLKTCISRDLLNHFLPNKDHQTRNQITNVTGSEKTRHIVNSMKFELASTELTYLQV